MRGKPITVQYGIIHGKTIELEREPGLPNGQAIAVEIRPIRANQPQNDVPPWWLKHLDIDPKVKQGKFVVKGTRLLADTLAEMLLAGQADADLRQKHPELTAKDVDAVREYAKLPLEMRRCFGSAADEADELDEFVEWARQHRKVGRQRIDD